MLFHLSTTNISGIEVFDEHVEGDDGNEFLDTISKYIWRRYENLNKEYCSK